MSDVPVLGVITLHFFSNAVTCYCSTFSTYKYNYVVTCVTNVLQLSGC